MLHRSVNRTLYGLLALFMGLFVVSSLFLRAKYNYGVYGDTPILERQKPLILLALSLLVLLGAAGLYRLSRWLEKYPRRAVIPGVLLLSFAVQAAIVLLFPRVPTDDSQTVLSLALDMLYDHDYSSFQSGGYLYMFPFNFSVVLYLRTLLALFPDNYLTIKLFSILFTLATAWLIYRIDRELNPKEERRGYGVLLAAAFFLPALFMNNLIYNDVIATALLTGSVYACIRFVRRGGPLGWIALSAALLAAGNYFRSIGALFLIASILYILLSLRSVGVKKALLALVLLVGLFNVPSWTQNAVLQASGITNEPVTKNSAPVYMWLNMGLNTDTWGFWDERESYSIYQNEAGYNQAASSVLFKQEIRRKLSEASPGELAGMYYRKLIWTWTEGTYQLDRYGIGNQSEGGRGMGRGSLMGGYSYQTAATRTFTSDSALRSGLLWIAYTANFLLYVCTLAGLVLSIRRRRFDEALPVLILLGFIAFYLVWEIKSRYIYPTYPLLILLACMGFRAIRGLRPAREGD
ncbi:hypothetical protein F4V43_03495 [Paenibacillus spiritus]|uniref:Glycosyltransferase RgtA/B/C/D-like domain-containing protein n=1 Tax=Paenibacillus spiritus TaxID=2496557 RepID=A0A5J5GHE3_9BACL|nr:glycosyltransferase family 39 protein [Paenibacillus spiritus]KAA9007565.1 hypothetical protein F4V43_03495 [Paenibacillus spiritus]